MRSIKSRLISVGAATVVATAGLVGVSASPAQAWPSGCQSRIVYAYGGGAEIICRSDWGWYRAVGYCRVFPESRVTYIRKGVWQYVGSGNWSSGSCDVTTPYGVGGYFEYSN